MKKVTKLTVLERVGYNVVMEWQKLGSKWVQKTKNRKK